MSSDDWAVEVAIIQDALRGVMKSYDDEEGDGDLSPIGAEAHQAMAFVLSSMGFPPVAVQLVICLLRQTRALRRLRVPSPRLPLTDS